MYKLFLPFCRMSMYSPYELFRSFSCIFLRNIYCLRIIQKSLFSQGYFDIQYVEDTNTSVAAKESWTLIRRNNLFLSFFRVSIYSPYELFLFPVYLFILYVNYLLSQNISTYSMSKTRMRLWPQKSHGVYFPYVYV